VNKPRIIIACHDAGGANQLLYWCLSYQTKCAFKFFLKGPAVNIFQQHFSPSLFINSIETCDAVITGSGWQTSFEREVIQICHLQQQYVITYLDHWANYLVRFELGKGQHIFPDEIWQADKYAFNIARSVFSSEQIKFRLIRNRYWQWVKKHLPENNPPSCILLILEPIRNKKIDIPKLYESTCSALIERFPPNTNLIIRQHPSGDDPCTQQIQIKLNNHFTLRTSHKNLWHDISLSQHIVGFQSSVLPLAIFLNRQAYSFYPNAESSSCLPQDGIKYWF